MTRSHHRHPKNLRAFYLYRQEDVSGVSGTGIVAVGVVLPSGHAVMEWCSRWPTVTVFQTIDQVERIHGHGGRTSIGWGLPPQTLEPEIPKGFKAWWKARAEKLRWQHLEHMAQAMLKVPTAPWWAWRMALLPKEDSQNVPEAPSGSAPRPLPAETAGRPEHPSRRKHS